jgi:hypothetical protein
MDFVKALMDAGEPELLQLTAEIARLERELAGLKVAERFLRARLGDGAGPPPAPRPGGKGTKKATPEQTLERRKAVALMLLREGCMPVAAIASRLGVKDHQAAYVVTHEWFARTDEGVRLTPAGRQANG